MAEPAFVRNFHYVLALHDACPGRGGGGVAFICIVLGTGGKEAQQNLSLSSTARKWLSQDFNPGPLKAHGPQGPWNGGFFFFP